MKQSDRYRSMKQSGVSEEKIKQAFQTPVEMQVFSYDGMIDTIMSPMDSIRYQKSFLRTGFMSMDPHTGHVKAYVGGPDFEHFQYNMVSVGRRQIGSDRKTLPLHPGHGRGFHPVRHVLERAAPPLITETGQAWSPRNSSKARVGEMVTLRWGLANSNNWISARLMDKLSPSSLARLMHSFGIKNKIDEVVSLCLGPVDVSVEEMVTAYTAFSNKGVRGRPPLCHTHRRQLGQCPSLSSPLR